MRLKFSKETIIGITTIVTLCLFIWVASFLKGRNLLSSEKEYYVLYTNSGGLAASNPVILSGVKVGRVSKVGFVSPEDPTIKVTICIKKDLFIPENTVASLESSGLLSGKQITLFLGNSKKAKEANTYFAGSEAPSLLEQLDPVKRKANSLISSIDSVITSLNQILNNQSIANLSSSFESLKNTMKHLEGASAITENLLQTEKDHLSLIVQNIESISSNLKANNNNINRILTNFSAISDSIAQANVGATFRNLNSTLENTYAVMDKINKGQGSLGLLVNNDSLYRELSSSATQLNLLLEDLRLNPGRYIHISVFGKKKEQKDK